MKRKKSRHKQLALEFLSNISLDGSNGSHVTHEDVPRASLRGRPLNPPILPHGCPYDSVVKTTAKTDEHDIHVSSSYKLLPQCQANTTPSIIIPYNVRTAGEIAQSDVRTASSVTTGRRTSAIQVPPTTNGRTSSSEQVHSLTVESTASKVLLNRRPCISARGSVDCKTFSSILNNVPCRRFSVRPPGFPNSSMAVFSVIAYNRNSSTTKPRTSYPRVRRSLGSATGAPNDADSGPLGTTPPKLIINGLFGSSSAGLDPSHLLSSFRCVGDEVKSFAQFLQSRHTSNSFQYNPPGTSPLGPILPFTAEPVPYGSATRSHESAISTSTGNTLEPLFKSGHAISNAICSIPPRRSQLWHAFHSTSYWSKYPARYRDSNGSSGVPGGGSSTYNGSCGASTAIPYPDPLLHYNPSLLDDPELFVVIRRRVFPLSSYLTSVLTYVRPSEEKKSVNRQFAERFPLIQLSLTKLRSLKAFMVQVIFNLSYDIWIAAHAHVLFEKLVLKLFIGKSNRRACAAASLLISAKLNDIKGTELTALIQELESHCRVARRDLFHAELDVCLGLEFCLVPPDSEILPHYLSICKRLDLTPPNPIPHFSYAQR
ncbi:unnamed protein product [Dicrocoelium dendriticum]|nr:unnamed protein product [Dicrocoelium dendriticum]CAH8490882.1 unnamed protein product [Dicrocoelium dendriticum]